MSASTSEGRESRSSRSPAGPEKLAELSAPLALKEPEASLAELLLL
jgi:hypothetical protein